MKNGLIVKAIIWGGNTQVDKKFSFKKVDEMSGRELFCVERLRSEVFVTEQKITLSESYPHH